MVDLEEPVLQIENLTVAYRQGKRWLEAVREVSLFIRAGETRGLVGESGSGKTTLVLAIMRYLGQDGAIRGGKIILGERDLLALDEDQMREVWGKQITLVPQNPLSSLNPSIKVGEQLAELLRHQLALDAPGACRLAIDWFERVHLADPERVAESYPHQISGGMQQRVLIAMALCTGPELLILDEPTTSLDVTTQAVILDLVRELIRGQKTAALYVTHNLGVVAQVCDRVAVMYAGELVEEATTQDLFRQPLHPYTQGLIDSLPRLGETKERGLLRSIQGQIPSLGDLPTGCVFRPRCPLAIEMCTQRPSLYLPVQGRAARCHRWEEIAQRQVSARQPFPVEIPSTPRGGETGQEVLKVKELAVHFPVSRSLDEAARRQPQKVVRAVNEVCLEINRGETLGLVGESGSGKTTLARAVMGLIEPTNGSIDLLQVRLPASLDQRKLETLRHLQMVFQNPEEALNPYLTVGETIRRPLMTLLRLSQKQADQVVARLLQAVRLPAHYAGRLPAQLSGGEMQRVAIARAFASNPDLLVCDEPVSSLDVSVQASILNLLEELQAERGSSLLFISHNLAVVGYLADRVAVVYLGHLMEMADAAELFEPPYHPYTEALLSAIPLVDPAAEQKNIRLGGEIPSPMNLPGGCPFHTRCPRFLGPICVEEMPPWQFDEASGKQYACHISPGELRAVQERAFSMGQSLAG